MDGQGDNQNHIRHHTTTTRGFPRKGCGRRLFDQHRFDLVGLDTGGHPRHLHHREVSQQKFPRKS